MNDEQLQRWVEQISMQSFGVPFLHRASFNPRLKTTGGRYLLGSHHIEINPKQLEVYGIEELEKIVKHELCHYHLHIAGRGYKHRDRDFRVLLAKVGGSRYCKALPGSHDRTTLPYRYKLICQTCGMEYFRKKRVDTNKYRCGKCHGVLRSYLFTN